MNKHLNQIISRVERVQKDLIIIGRGKSVCLDDQIYDLECILDDLDIIAESK